MRPQRRDLDCRHVDNILDVAVVRDIERVVDTLAWENYTRLVGLDRKRDIGYYFGDNRTVIGYRRIAGEVRM
jgi:hypothetical protein